jgi:hypothetical protein
MIPISSDGMLPNDGRYGSDHLGPQGLVEASRITPHVTLDMLTDAIDRTRSIGADGDLPEGPPVTDSPAIEIPRHLASCTKRQRL